jgi:uncharacterized protein (TIGR02996 family)
MTEDDAFVQAVLASPADDAPRLIYADWLEERGDPRGEYLRTELTVAAPRRRKAKDRSLRRRLQELRGHIDPSWLAIFDQPRILRANPTPFPAGWCSVDLEGYRAVDGTYGLLTYESLPPLPVELFRGDFHWLAGQRKSRATSARVIRHRQVDRITAAAADLKLALPNEFRVLMGRPALRRRVRSCTDCFFNWPKRIDDGPADEDDYVVRFYSDSQGCFHWYLYLTPLGYHCVLGSPAFFGGANGLPEEFDADTPWDECWFCAPSFEAFVYRMWIENEIWYALSDDDHPLTAEEQAYLAHYRLD